MSDNEIIKALETCTGHHRGCTECPYCQEHGCVDQVMVDALDLIKRQSEGEWIDKPTGAYGRMQSWCSACGKHSGIGGIESNRHKPYCPNCGAKMKGGGE